jgi:hypothetical protein
LAGRIARCCQADPELARRTIAYQLAEVLRRQQEDRLRLEQQARLPQYVRDLSHSAQQLFVEQPDSWELRLFSAVLAAEIGLQESLRRDYEKGLSWGPRSSAGSSADLVGWLALHIAEAEQFGPNLDLLLNTALPEAMAPPGIAADAEAIIDVARKIAEGHRRAIEWVLAIRRHVSDRPPIQRVLRAAERLVHNLIREVREFSETLETTIQSALADGAPGPKQFELTRVLSVPPGSVEELQESLEALRQSVN